MQRLTKAAIAAAAAALCAGAPAVPLAAAPERLPAGPRCVRPEGDAGCLPTAPPSARVDLERPTFSRPTAITNPLFPVSRQRSLLLLGRAGGQPLRVEVTLLPRIDTIRWRGRPIRTRVSQYVAFLGGRMAEVALDRYAQADDGAVWYLGEDVFNYDARGAVADREGTWLAGRDDPPAMIMPARPWVGDVFRPENAPGVVFEEVTVTAVGLTVPGPRGPVRGAIAVRELHADGGRERKLFAPGYGEFSTGLRPQPGGARPGGADRRPPGAAPGAPARPLRGRQRLRGRPRRRLGRGRGRRRAGRVRPAQAWGTRGAPADRAAPGRRPAAAGGGGRGASAGHCGPGGARRRPVRPRPPASPRHPAAVDRARLALWRRQLTLDASLGRASEVAGDRAALRWIRDRIVGAPPG